MPQLATSNPAFIEVPGQRVWPQVQSSSLFVLNGDTKTQSSDIDDPFDCFLSGFTKHYCKINPGFPYLDLYHAVSGATDATVAPSFAIFGWIPWMQRPNEGPPSDIDATNFNHPNHATLLGPSKEVNQGMWVPLLRPIDQAHVMTFATARQVNKDAATALGLTHWATTDGARVNCGGSTHVLGLITNPGTVYTAGMLLGRFASL